MTINEKQLDRRLAGFLNDTIDTNRTRRECLRSLKVEVTNSFYNLVASAVACLANLSALSLDFIEVLNSKAINILADAVELKNGLHELQLTSPTIQPIDILYERYISKNPDHTIKISALRDGYPLWTRASKNGFLHKAYSSREGGISGIKIDWSKLVSLSLDSWKESSSWVAAILAGLGDALVSFSVLPPEEI